MEYRVIKCPLTSEICEKYKGKFHSLGKLIKAQTNGMVYIRGVDVVGVLYTTYCPNTNHRWISMEVDQESLEKHEIDKLSLFDTMLRDAIHKCGGDAMVLPDTEKEKVACMAKMPMQVTNGGNGSVIGYYEHREKDVILAEYTPFLEEFQDTVETTWTLGKIDHGIILEIQKSIEQFLLKHKDMFSRLYQWAMGGGKYTEISPRLNYERILVKYEEYFNDLTKYIKSVDMDDIVSRKGISSNLEKCVTKAIDIDNHFREKLFSGDQPALTLVTDAVPQLNVFIDVDLFLQNVYDSFISCGGSAAAKNDNGYIALLNVYGYSVTEFLKEFIKGLCQNVFDLEKRMLGSIEDATPQSTYRYEAF